MTGQNFFLPCLSLLCLIAINAFFTAAEFSIVAVRRSRITQLAENGDIQAQTVQSFQRGIDRLLSTTQLGITLSSLALGWTGEQTIAVLITRIISNFPLPESIIKSLAFYLAIPLAFIVLAYFQIVLGELVPKSLALLYPEQLARFFAPPSMVIASIFRPFIAVLNTSTRLLLRLGKIQYSKQLWQEQLTAKELQLIVNTKKESPDLAETERELINNVLEFRDALASEIMIPRTEIKFLEREATFADLLEHITNESYFRYPLIDTSLDDIQGIIDYKSLAVPLAREELTKDSLLTPWIQPILFVEESKPIRELLSLMQEAKQTMVIVIDQFGGTSGLITLQDLIKEIIGNQNDISYSQTQKYQKIDSNTFVVSAQMSLEDVNRSLQTNLPTTEGYHTLSGFLQDKWQKIPQEKETLDYENLKFTVMEIENNRLHHIKIELQETFNPDSFSDSNRYKN